MKCKTKNNGLSLIEIQVALVIGLLLTAGAIQLFIGNQRTYRTETALSKLQQTGRFVVEQMAKDIRMIGYTGCSGRASDRPQILQEPVSAPLPQSDITADLIGVAVAEASGGSWLPAPPNVPGFPNIPPAPSNGPAIPGSDAITIQRAHQCGTGAIGQVSKTNINIVAPNQCGFRANQPILITDCSDAEIFQNTVDLPDNGPQETLVPFTPLKQEYGGFGINANVFVYRFLSNTYFIAPSALQIGEANPQPSLWRATWAPSNTNNALDIADFVFTELADGVADLQIRYGVDTDADEIPDTYQNGNQVVDTNNILTVQISLLLQSPDRVTEQPQVVVFNGQNINDPNSGTTDNRLRTVYTTTISVKNRLPVALDSLIAGP